MDFDILKSVLGAIVGFFLAQFVNLAQLVYNRFTRPRLSIDASQTLILSHSTEINPGEYAKEELYGFTVGNTGRRIATGVEFQLLQVDVRYRKEDEFRTVVNHTFALSLYTSSSGERGATKVTLVPGSAVLVHLATGREDYDAIFPIVDGIPDYYEETCSEADGYRFTVATFGDDGEPATAVVTIDTRKLKQKVAS